MYGRHRSNMLILTGGAVQDLFSPLVQALAGQFGRQGSLAVNLGADPKRPDLPGKSLLRLFANPGALSR